MSTVWKVLLGLAVVLPLGAYVAGSLAASAADDPQPRHTIQIREPEHRPQPSRTPSGTPDPSPGADVEVIVPEYDDYDDRDEHGDDDHGDDDHGDDRSGHGHGGDDDSDDHGGHGHGGED
jgi:hypothetical protein